VHLSELSSPIPSLESIGISITSPIKEGPTDLIPGLLPRQGQLVIAGQTDIGKSLSALEICSSLTTGKPLWGELEPTIKAKRILYVLGEHYVEVIQRLWQHTKLPMTDQVFILGPEQLGFDKWLVAQGKPNLQAISKFQKWAKDCDLVVFDPLSAFVTGIDVENDNIQMRLVLDTMTGVAQSTGASCLVLAHQGKPYMGQDGQEHARKSYAIRGASAIEDAATNIFYLGKSAGVSDVAQKATDNQIFAMTRRKYKGSAPSEYKLLRDPITLTHTLLGNRPFVEVMKIATQAKMYRLREALPEMSTRDVVKIIAATEGINERTVWRHLE
jgi:RecA-family ATPase